MNTIDPSGIIGLKFGRLVPIEFKYAKKKTKFYLCQCDCGKQSIVTNYRLRYGRTKSCGCLAKERQKAACTTHGQSSISEYHIWVEMRARCNNSNSRAYRLYGGRGIKVCGRWESSFDAFFADMGYRPTPKHSIDRIEVDKGYSPDNCRWATKKEQACNRRCNRYITLDGETKTITDWCRVYNISRRTVHHRETSLGFSVKDALSIRPNRKIITEIILKNKQQNGTKNS